MMGKAIISRLSLQLALIVNFVILIVAVVGISIYLTKENHQDEDRLLASIKYKSMIGAKMVGTIMDESIDNGVFSVEDVFDTKYEQIGKFNPPKYHTRYDIYLDKAVLKLQDEFLKDKNILYAAGVDKNGYLPTHNSRYQQAFTGDPEKDKAGNRTKRLFNDKVGLKAAENTIPGFRQIYHRDTGETVWDISSPVYIKNKHWGGFRIGVSLAAISKLHKELSFAIFRNVFLTFIISTVLTYCFVFYLLGPLRRMTDKIGEWASGRNIENRIVPSSKGEFGELQKALELLRLSILNISKKNRRV